MAHFKKFNSESFEIRLSWFDHTNLTHITMGEQRVSLAGDSKDKAQFMRHLLEDVQALEYMLDNDMFENGNIHIGAEQEMCLIDANGKPAPLAMPILEKMTEHEWVETELAKFNLEITLTPQPFKGDALKKMEEEIRTRLHKIQEVSSGLNTNILLTGILPSLRKSDLTLDNLTPKKRYRALMDAIDAQLNRNSYELKLAGVDEMHIKHDSPMLEASNTSFQVHLQVAPRDFVKMYNISMALTGPLIAISANSPLLFGKRLWHETRIALFQQALDTRRTNYHMRELSPRVMFGTRWLQDSILDIYREDIARFRVLLSADVKEDSIDMIRKGLTPNLMALQVHNSTVYRWNRPCYGAAGEKPHLRIECRVLPAGPTVIDEMANAALWLGAMIGIAEQLDDVRDVMSFDDARDNFSKASRYGLDSKFTWWNDEKITAPELILNHIIPLARKGLEHRGVDQADIDRYMDVIEGRAKKHMTGARWILRSYTQLLKETNKDEAVSSVTNAILKNQRTSQPVHLWEEPTLDDGLQYRIHDLQVEEFMQTDIYTVRPDDPIDLVTDLLDWRSLRYVPVENEKGDLVGLVTMRLVLRHYTTLRKALAKQPSKTVEDIMIKSPITIKPETTVYEAVNLIRREKIGCLPVVKDGELIGVLTETDFLNISGRILDRLKRHEQTS